VNAGANSGDTAKQNIEQTNVMPARIRTHGHGAGQGSPTYLSWRGAKKRCRQPTHDSYSKYGAVGVCMCNSWFYYFENFLADMGERPEGKTLDRINYKGHYSCGHCPECVQNEWPMNCRWLTPKEQARNRANNHIITVFGITGCMYELAEHFGFKPSCISERLRRGWSPEKTFSTPVRKQ
jgi:hypothetical protein